MDIVKSVKESVGRLQKDYKTQNHAMVVLRIFLSATWIYAGYYKAQDAGFLSPGSPTYIGKDLLAYSNSSPIGVLISPLLPYATGVGIFVMVSEFAIGYATMTGLFPIFSAFMGALMSLGLFLASSFHVKPYFLGSDLPYMFLWVIYALNLTKKRANKIENIKKIASPSRRTILKVIGVSLLSIFTPLLGRSSGKINKSKAKAGGSRIITSLDKLKVGESMPFTSSKGLPSVLFRSKIGVFAYSAVCTHQGCTLLMDQSSKTLQCPCHGATFDPYNGARVISGPAPSPLPPVKVKVEGSNIFEV